MTQKLFQFQCDKEGTLFYYQHGSLQTARAIINRCPVCGSKRVKATGCAYKGIDESALPSRADARLIAAASELLRHLRDAVANLNVTFPRESGGPMRDAIHRYEQIIAKACPSLADSPEVRNG
jgi:hypothetical protein